jgi:hypothetical protein
VRPEPAPDPRAALAHDHKTLVVAVLPEGDLLAEILRGAAPEHGSAMPQDAGPHSHVTSSRQSNTRQSTFEGEQTGLVAIVDGHEISPPEMLQSGAESASTSIRADSPVDK